VDAPAQEEVPENRGEAKLDDPDAESALEQLPKTGNEEAGECGDDVAGGTLACHRILLEPP